MPGDAGGSREDSGDLGKLGDVVLDIFAVLDGISDLSSNVGEVLDALKLLIETVFFAVIEGSLGSRDDCFNTLDA